MLIFKTGEHLKLSYLSPYLVSLAPNFTSGVNFAVAGAMTLPQFVPFQLDVQVRQFVHFKNRSLELLSLGMFISTFPSKLPVFHIMKQCLRPLIKQFLGTLSMKMDFATLFT